MLVSETLSAESSERNKNTVEDNRAQNGDVPYVANDVGQPTPAQAPTPLFVDVARPTLSAPATQPLPQAVSAAVLAGNGAPADNLTPLPPAGVGGAPQPAKKPRDWRKVLTRSTVVTLVLLLIGTGILLFDAFRNQSQRNQVNNAIANTTIPLSEFANSGSLSLLGAQSLTVNGQLRANESFILTPNAQPTNTEKGQLYYDKNSNVLAYYNGTQYVQLTGQNGGVVQSLQGQSGAVTLVGGNGITITGTTLTNSGVTSLGAATGDITLGAGLSLTNNTLANNGIISVKSATPSITVTNDGAGNLTVSGSGAAGVNTLNGLGGDLTIANATGSGATITINNADTAGGKGLATFNASNFSATAGLVNTIQDINTTASPTFGSLALSSSQSSNPMLLINNTNASATGNLLDAKLNGSSKFSVAPSGNVSASGTINGQTITNVANFTGTLGVASTLTAGGAIQANGGSITSTGGLNITPTGTLTLGSNSQTLSLQGGTSSSFAVTSGGNTTTLNFQAPTATVTYRLPTAAAGNYDLCSTAGNCAGVGGGVTTSGGTANKIAKFTASQGVGDSSITDNGTTVTTTANLVVQGGAMTVGVANSQSGTLTLAYGSANFSGSITQGALTANRTYTLPDTAGTICLSSGNCLGGGGGGANTSLSNLTGVAINTSLLPGSTSIDLGSSTAPFRNLYIAGSSLTPSSNNFTITGTATAARTITLPDASGTVCLDNGNCSGTGAYILNQNASDQTANLRITGTARANTSVQTPTLDTATATTLNIGASGTPTTTAINLNQNTTVANNKTLTVLGTALIQPASNNSSALTVKDSSNNVVLNVDTTNQRVGVGGVASASKFEVQGGDAAIYNSGANPRLILGDNTTAGNNGYIQWDSTNKYIRIETAGTNGLKVNDNFVAIGNITPDQPLKVASGSTLLAQVNTTGQALFRTSTNSATALQVQNTGGTDTIFDVDTSNRRVGINTSAPTATLTVVQNTSTPGTVSNSASSATVTGSSTTFTSTFSAGDTFTITSSGNSCTVSIITSDTSLTCTATLSGSSSGSTYTFTAQTRLAVTDNGHTNVNGTLNLTNTSAGHQFSVGVNPLDGQLKFGSNVIGKPSLGPASDNNGSFIMATKYNSGTGGTISSLYVNLRSIDGAGPHFKVALYADSGGVPGSRISSATAPSTTGVVGWNNASLGGTYTLTPNTNYWLAFTTESGNTFFSTHSSGSGSTKYQSGFTWGTNFPNTFTVNASSTDNISIYAAYSSVNVNQSTNNGGISIGDNNTVTISPLWDTDGAFVVQTVGGTSLLDVDTTSQTVGVSKLLVNSSSTSAFLNVGGGTNNSAATFTGGINGTQPVVLIKGGSSPTATANLLTVTDTNDNKLVTIDRLGTTTFQNSSGVAALTVDATNAQITVGPAAGNTTGTIFVLGNKTNTGDPAGVVGGMYYNSNTGSFRCYLVDHWTDCLVSARTSYHKTYELGYQGGGADSDYITYATSGGGISQEGGETSHPGITQLYTLGSGGYGYSGSHSDLDIRLGNGDYWRYETVFRMPSAFAALSTPSERYIVRSGFHMQVDEFVSGESPNGCFFRYSDNINSGKWQGYCATNGTASFCDTTTTVAMDTWYRMTVVVNSAGTQADFRINGVSKCTVSTNIPTAANRQTGFGNSIQMTAGTTNSNIDVDYEEIEGQFGTPR